ncbi:MAG TPA: diaminopimelate epimerase, partial [Flavobacteriaceae bacterium]|nr:diaminopimelate epimerase [Flavobacteriaceae bacterium]
GADGLILLESPKDFQDDFSMVYFNADGKESSMCGNGGRCIARFAKKLGIVKSEAKFTAIDGPHTAIVEEEMVRLKMGDVTEIKSSQEAYFLNTGSPHLVIFTEEIDAINVKSKGAKIRYSEEYKKEGTNVNFVEIKNGFFAMRTYERGVENETLACGTGAVAVALAAHFSGKTSSKKIVLETLGGKLSVDFEKTSGEYRNIWLNGPAKQVFMGEIVI